MARMLGFCEDAGDAELLRNVGRDVAADLDLPTWQAELLLSLSLFLERVAEGNDADICCIDVTPEGAIRAAEEVRRRFERVQMLILAGLDTSPMTYLRPSIRASSLLLKPFNAEQARMVVAELLEEMARELRNTDTGSYTLETKKGKTAVPYREILYFEARERKIFLCTRNRQLPFYSTLESLCEELPQQFTRCHKGFIVNRDHIEHIAFAQNTIHLLGGFQIPVSRSYKSVVRELLV